MAGRPSIEVQPRTEFGSRVTRRLRNEGIVPGIVYGTPEGDCLSFQVNARELRRTLAGSGALLDLKLHGEERPVIVKDQQWHPVRGELIHIDFLQVRLDETIQTQVEVVVEGVEEAHGVKEGGVLSQETHLLNIEALPTDIPDQIVADVSGLGIAETLTLSALTPPAGVTFLDDLDETVIATVVVPTEEPEEPEVEEEAAVVGEDGEVVEGEAPADGEAPAEGDQGGEPAAEGESSGE
jgi:large subunit ribosomal protein L25